MTRKEIEENAVDYLSLRLRRCPGITPEIPKNDKSPFWDGKILVYSSKGKDCNGSFLGNVPVQVKGKEKIPDPNSYITYPVALDALRAYYNDGGVLYFVIYVLESGQHQIYYSALLPFDLKKTIRRIENRHAKQKNIKFRALPEDDLVISELLQEFLTHKKKQATLLGMPLEAATDFSCIQFDKMELSICAPSIEQSLQRLTERENYLYGVKNVMGCELRIPIEKFEVASLVKTGPIPVSITVDGTEYFTSKSVQWTKEEKSTTFDDCLTLGEKGEECFLNITGTLNQQLNIWNFFQALARNKGIYVIDGTEVTESGIVQDINHLRQHFELVQRTVETMAFLGATENLNLGAMDARECLLLDRLHGAVAGKPIDVKITPKRSAGIVLLRLANLELLVHFKQTDDHRYYLSSAFNAESQNLCIQLNDRAEKVDANWFVLLRKKEQWKRIYNYDYDALKRAYIKTKFSDDFATVANLNALDMIAAADEEPRVRQLWSVALEIEQWLLGHRQNCSSYQLNTMQIKYRLGILDKEDIQKLCEIEQRPETPEDGLAAAILLRDKEKCEKWEAMTPRLQLEELKKYPIYTLYPTTQNVLP